MTAQLVPLAMRRNRSITPINRVLLFLFCCFTPILLLDAASLSSLTPSIGDTFSPTFDPSIYFYTLNVPYASKMISFTPTLTQDSTLAGVKIYATWHAGSEFAMQSGASSKQLEIDSVAPFTELLINLVDSTPSTPNVTYTIEVIRSTVVGKNANLLGFGLQLSAADTSSVIQTMNPSNFSSLIYNYTILILPNLASFTYKPLIDSTASLNLTTSIRNPTDSKIADMTYREQGDNVTAVKVSVANIVQLRMIVQILAEDGETKKEYWFTVTNPTPNSQGGDVSSSGSSSSSSGLPSSSSSGVSSSSSTSSSTAASSSSTASTSSTASSSTASSSTTPSSSSSTAISSSSTAQISSSTSSVSTGASSSTADSSSSSSTATSSSSTSIGSSSSSSSSTGSTSSSSSEPITDSSSSTGLTDHPAGSSATSTSSNNFYLTLASSFIFLLFTQFI